MPTIKDLSHRVDRLEDRVDERCDRLDLRIDQLIVKIGKSDLEHDSNHHGKKSQFKLAGLAAIIAATLTGIFQALSQVGVIP